MNENYPVGNARVGDPAWYRPTPYLQWQKKCEVIAVGELNEVGHPTSVRLRTEADGDIVIPPFPPFSVKNGRANQPQALILAKQYPPRLLEAIRTYDLMAVRDGGNQKHERFKILCLACMEWIYLGQTTIESADIRFDLQWPNGRFQAGKPEVSETGYEVVCGCPAIAYDFVVFDYNGESYQEEN